MALVLDLKANNKIPNRWVITVIQLERNLYWFMPWIVLKACKFVYKHVKISLGWNPASELWNNYTILQKVASSPVEVIQLDLKGIPNNKCFQQ